MCTSTLELGIDAGDLDGVLQANAPSTVSAFLQRMGRTGRRAGQRATPPFSATIQRPCCGVVIHALKHGLRLELGLDLTAVADNVSVRLEGDVPAVSLLHEALGLGQGIDPRSGDHLME